MSKIFCVIFFIMFIISSIRFEIYHFFDAKIVGVLDIGGWVVPAIFMLLFLYFFIKIDKG